MELLITTLLSWIEMHTNYRTHELPHPEVVVLSHKKLTEEYYRNADGVAPESDVDMRLKALYAFEDGAYGTIYILDPQSVTNARHYDNPLDNPNFKEVLLHELVHHVQWHSKAVKQWQCSNQGELEAYLLGAMYLNQYNTHDTMTNRTFWANSYSRC
ncbi:MAG: hypothetical protein SWN10_03195 [Pseudomonadota bacterium]|nr:hypothetical protein [Pseudomonadota bacterium]